MRVLVVEPERRPEAKEIDDSLKEMQGIVGGYIQSIYPFECGAPADSDHFTSLTPEQIEQYRKMFYTPEMFWGMNGRIVCLPLEVD